MNKEKILDFIFIAMIFIWAWMLLQYVFSTTNNTEENVKASVTIQQDSNLTNKKPRRRWRLNSNWYSQKYTELHTTTVSERTAELLEAYWMYNYQDRKVIAKVHDIKPEVLVCITYADTSIGRFLKSKNNIGNVWNNDRWDTVEYTNVLKGIDAIWRVLNNRYLWEYNEMRQLAWGTNKDWPVYATSEENWLINTLNCLWMIYDSEIDWWFNFRTK